MSRCIIFKNEIEYLGHLVPVQGIASMRWKIKAITDQAPATNITKEWHMIGLIGYYRKFFPVFSDTISPLNELTKNKCTIQMDREMSKKLRLDQASHYYKPNFSLPRPR